MYFISNEISIQFELHQVIDLAKNHDTLIMIYFGFKLVLGWITNDIAVSWKDGWTPKFKWHWVLKLTVNYRVSNCRILCTINVIDFGSIHLSVCALMLQ